MNLYLIFILTILITEYLLSLVIDTLNLRNASPVLPKEFEGFYDAEKYKKSQSYLQETTKFSLLKGGFTTVILILFIVAGGFRWMDEFARNFHLSEILTGLIFAGILMLLFQAFSIPFAYYRTFVIEEKYGFNKTTKKTFFLDLVKGLTLGLVIGGIIFAVIIYFFEIYQQWAWFYSWIAVVTFEIFMMFIAPVVIMPLFNKFIPLEEGTLKRAIEDYAESQNFLLKGIFKMDASKRSAKSNAFFTGFGKFRRIVLFDTLIEKHTTEELVSVLAHEIGHYKKKHIMKQLLLSIVASGTMFYVLSFFIGNRGLFDAFSIREVSVYGSLILFSFLYGPIHFIFSIIENIFSRKYEYEADYYAVLTYRQPRQFILALKKLSVDNLSNLTPHPLKVFFEYSHPPVLKRINAIALCSQDREQ